MLNMSQAKKYLQRGGFILVAAGFMYTSNLGLLSYVAHWNSPKLYWKGKLEDTVRAEAELLGFHEEITIKIEDNGKTPGLSYKQGGKYFVQLSPDRADLAELRHELYHIANGHLDSNSINSFWQEPKATFYAFIMSFKDRE